MNELLKSSLLKEEKEELDIDEILENREIIPINSDIEDNIKNSTDSFLKIHKNF